LYLLLAMLLAAVLATYAHANKLLGGERRPSKNAFALSLISTVLVPVFLSSINSSVLKDASFDPWKWTVFFGYCVIAALIPRPFIQGVVLNLRKHVEQAESRADSVSEYLHSLVLNEAAIVSRKPVAVTEPESFVLNALGNSPYRWLPLADVEELSTLDASAKSKLLDGDRVAAVLAELVEKQLVTQLPASESIQIPLWGITALGKVSVRHRNEREVRLSVQPTDSSSGSTS
jgi:hypothetical protein